MQIRIIGTPISRDELVKIAKEGFGDMVKAVVDINRQVIALGGELHADEEAALLQSGSRQQDLWGINLYPDKQGEEFVEFDSLINLRPSQGNRTRGVDNPELQGKIKEAVRRIVKDG